MAIFHPSETQVAPAAGPTSASSMLKEEGDKEGKGDTEGDRRRGEKVPCDESASQHSTVEDTNLQDLKLDDKTNLQDLKLDDKTHKPPTNASVRPETPRNRTFDLLTPLKRYIPTRSPAPTPSPTPSHTPAPPSTPTSSPPTTSLRAKYGKPTNFLGQGSHGSCYLVRRPSDDRAFCVKEFRKRSPDQSQKEWIKKLTSEYCIGSLLHHPNIIETHDLIFDRPAHHNNAHNPNGPLRVYTVMDLCPGGDLFTCITSHPQPMTIQHANCIFVQLLKGVEYLHNLGVCHRDLKPENCLFDEHDRLKIIDFGSADVFRMPWGLIGLDPTPTTFPSPSSSPTLPPTTGIHSSPPTLDCDTTHHEQTHIPNSPPLTPETPKIHPSKGCHGSLPYIAPEEHPSPSSSLHSSTHTPPPTYDGTKVDIWSLAIIYITILTKRFPWRCASMRDPDYALYVRTGRHKLIDSLPEEVAGTVRRMLSVGAGKRPGVGEILSEEWVRNVRVCGEGGEWHGHGKCGR
ncbi:hypothetical protein HDV00_011564 [Rhizophlyctis rosea]|nr:hypothetical protein HDV00_011564 [Rhizophlyctis rosea]